MKQWAKASLTLLVVIGTGSDADLVQYLQVIVNEVVVEDGRGYWQRAER